MTVVTTETWRGDRIALRRRSYAAWTENPPNPPPNSPLSRREGAYTTFFQIQIIKEKGKARFLTLSINSHPRTVFFRMCLIFSVVHNANSGFEINLSEFLFQEIHLADRSCHVINLALTSNSEFWCHWSIISQASRDDK